MDYFATPKNPKSDDLEVTGISRSGRVRKKSSKLLDFESPDDVTEQRLKRQRAQQHLHAQQILEKYEQSQKLKQQNIDSPVQSNSLQQNNTPRPLTNNIRQRNNIQQQPVQIKQEVKEEDTQESSEDEEESSESGPEAETNGIHHEESSEESSSDDDEDDDDDESEEEEVEPVMEITGFTKLEPPEQTELPSQAKNSLYMLEKSRKKLVIKDGKVISKTTKSQRKDKGVTRFTAYMLWSKEARQQLVEHHPNLDFATISKKLGELWATVPNLEKHNWKKRAKRMAQRSVSQNNKLSHPSRQFINKIGSLPNRENAAPKRTIHLGVPSIGNKLYVSPPHHKSGKDEAFLGSYKVTGTQPIDVAAHLALLGESLTLIGKRLKEHEGQITVSGSLPLLLDSLLCALGPLLCLTQQIPEMNGADPEVLSTTLENVAYIMPDVNDNPILSNEVKDNEESAKIQRKNKKVKRYTAYSLWCREPRQQLFEHNPRLDFSTISRALSELWATVPKAEKSKWKKKAKPLQSETAAQNDPFSQVSHPFANEIGSSANPDITTPKTTVFRCLPTRKKKLNVSPPRLFGPNENLNEAYAREGTQPIDVAAHLALLGESLTLIGKRLKEHEGQITVTGTLPLLLDSLLSALGSLICLTQQIPEMNGADPDILSSTLENIVYFMPACSCLKVKNA